MLRYFRAIVDELERGGYPRLLHELLTFDLTRVDLRTIAKTEGHVAEQGRVLHAV